MFAGGLSSMVGDEIKGDDPDSNAGLTLNFLGVQVNIVNYFNFFNSFNNCFLKFPAEALYILQFHGRTYESLLVRLSRTKNLSVTGTDKNQINSNF